MKYLKLLTICCILAMASCSDDNSDAPINPSDDRNRFVGSWTCSESSGQTFGITIGLEGSNDSIYINNFSNYGSSAKAIGLVSGNSLTIPAQHISITSVYVKGTGILNGQGNKISMDYIADTDTITATCTKN